MPTKEINDGYTAKDIYDVLDRIDHHIQERDIDMTRVPLHMPSGPDMRDIKQSLDSLDGTLAGIHDELKELNQHAKEALNLVSRVLLLREKRTTNQAKEKAKWLRRNELEKQ